MSAEKLYAVKNDEGKYWDFADRDGFFELGFASCSATDDERYTKNVVRDHGGRVVTLVEVPEKVVISKTNALRQGWLVARYGRYNPDAVSDILARYKDEAWDMIDAYVNGYTVAKEKKYNVKVPYAEGWHFQKYSSASKLGARNNWRPFPAKDIDSNMSKELFRFTESEIEQYGLQDCEKEEVTDDDD
ncbi:hypothetical protein BKQ19_05215 [Lacticaseibacillus paracasei]|uniref:DUF1642 domain-containing protein n=1 Tax=Lacticaseibacillus paracasei TaxID=1597 RepID=UPI000B99D3CE|nr:DUF1642 domain-containing protein [Lacticaseibacillus paracasei]ASU12179.1 hypothetical protein BKQ19_05215 [Lacticaseibacillus paracasei]